MFVKNNNQYYKLERALFFDEFLDHTRGLYMYTLYDVVKTSSIDKCIMCTFWLVSSEVEDREDAVPYKQLEWTHFQTSLSRPLFSGGLFRCCILCSSSSHSIRLWAVTYVCLRTFCLSLFEWWNSQTINLFSCSWWRLLSIWMYIHIYIEREKTKCVVFALRTRWSVSSRTLF